MALPEVVSKAVALAMASGRKLSWSIQENQRGMLVKLVWKSAAGNASRRDVVGTNKNAANTGFGNASAGGATSRATKPVKSKPPSSRRRSARRLQEFLEKKQGVNVMKCESRCSDQASNGVDAAGHASEGGDQDLCDHRGDSSHNTQDLPDVPTTPQPSDLNRAISTDLSLDTCESVVYDARDGQPGVKFKSCSGHEGWTPIKKDVAASRTRKGDGCRSNPLTCQDKELPLTYAREVAYMKIDGTPGITFRRGCTRHSYEWLPIAPSPIASRTRTKMKS